jgi:hypothetical protein
MKNIRKVKNKLRAEYDFSKGVRGKHAGRRFRVVGAARTQTSPNNRVGFPARVTKRWLQSLSDAALIAVEQRAYEELQRRNLLKDRRANKLVRHITFITSCRAQDHTPSAARRETVRYILWW